MGTFGGKSRGLPRKRLRAQRARFAAAFALGPLLLAAIMAGQTDRGMAQSIKVAMRTPFESTVAVPVPQPRPPAVWLDRGSAAIATVPSSGWLADGGSLFEPAVGKTWATIKQAMSVAPASFIGIASMYNPYLDGNDDDAQTASGEMYDPAAWTAAIQIDLRDRFGGVRYGRLYRPAYALVECGRKRAVVKINDVGPLKPGRVIDLNERSMRYFDPTLKRGLIDARITLLPGEDWTPGPLADNFPLTLVSASLPEPGFTPIMVH
jgi:rare lipoprotein A